jgi:hypothetical protein
MRNDESINQFFQHQDGVDKVLSVIEKVQDEELVANSFKIIRVLLRNDFIYDSFASQYPNLGNVIVEILMKWTHSLPVVIESANSLRNFTRRPEVAKSLHQMNVEKVLDFSIQQRGN